ncbi:sigma factor-like helix-turn-helix DNA-binding protein [Streptomyces sp. NPDC000229]|uniref:sigma factor-like helix-turn-helix DNA-binding protein n=1 Tax=Streptomyces sp. NPDC000229 TaxID=3154247 RepID=UPI00331FC384
MRRERKLVPTAEVEPRSAAPWDGGVERRAAEIDVSRLLTLLTPQQAGSMILVDLDGYTLDQAARIMGVHRGTVARTRARALDRLRRRIRAGLHAPPGTGSSPADGRRLPGRSGHAEKA